MYCYWSIFKVLIEEFLDFSSKLWWNNFILWISQRETRRNINETLERMVEFDFIPEMYLHLYLLVSCLREYLYPSIWSMWFCIMVKSLYWIDGLKLSKAERFQLIFEPNFPHAVLQLSFKQITSVKQQHKNGLSPYIMKASSRCSLQD